MRILMLDLHISNNPCAALRIVNAVKPYFNGDVELVRFYSRDFNFKALSECDGIILSGLDKSRLLNSGKMQRLKSHIRRLESATQVLGICGGHQVLANGHRFPTFVWQRQKIISSGLFSIFSNKYGLSH